MKDHCLHARFLSREFTASVNWIRQQANLNLIETEREYSLSNCVIQEFVGSQVALQTPNIQTECVVQAINSCQLDREPNFVTLIDCPVANIGSCAGAEDNIEIFSRGPARLALDASGPSS